MRTTKQLEHASELRYRRLFETAQDGILILDAETGAIDDVNPFLIKMLGYSREEFVEKKLWEVGPFKDTKASKEAFDELQHKKYIRYDDLPLKAKDGQIIQVEFVSNVYQVEGKKVIQCNIRDIRERVLADKRSRFQASLMDNATDAIIASDADFRITEWNKASELLYGWKAEEVIGHFGVDITLTEWPGENAENMRRMIAATGHWRGEVIQQRKDGTRFPVEVSSNVLIDKSGKIVGYFSLNHDITEKKLAELEIVSLAKFPSENPNPVLRLNGNGIVLYANASADPLLSIWGCSVGDYVPQFWRESIANVLGSGNPKIVEIEIEEKVYSIIIAPIIEEGYVNLYGIDITHRKRAESKLIEGEERIRILYEEAQKRLDRTLALRKIDKAINSILDLQLTLGILLEHLLIQLKVDAADILLYDPSMHVLKYCAGKGFRAPGIKKIEVPMGAAGFAGRAVLERKHVHIPDLRKETKEYLSRPDIAIEGFIDYHVVPIISKGKVLGTLATFQRSLFEANSEWLDYLETLAGQAAIAIDSITLFESLQSANDQLVLGYDTTIEGWSRALDMRDKETEGHTQRVTKMCVKLSSRMGIRAENLVNLRRGALLHDIGKMGVPDSILSKAGELTEEEWVLMKKHPQLAYDMLSPIFFLREALDIPQFHHEKWDGSGYSHGLKGDSIPLAARIFAVVDVYDALTSDRPYRKAWSKEKAIEHIREQKGKHFDPQVVEEFFKFLGVT